MDTAEGNPLFLEQLVAVGAESGDAALPPNIQAVLAARIDRLSPASAPCSSTLRFRAGASTSARSQS